MIHCTFSSQYQKSTYEGVAKVTVLAQRIFRRESSRALRDGGLGGVAYNLSI